MCVLSNVSSLYFIEHTQRASILARSAAIKQMLLSEWQLRPQLWYGDGHAAAAISCCDGRKAISYIFCMGNENRPSMGKYLTALVYGTNQKNVLILSNLIFVSIMIILHCWSSLKNILDILHASKFLWLQADCLEKVTSILNFRFSCMFYYKKQPLKSVNQLLLFTDIKRLVNLLTCFKKK